MRTFRLHQSAPRGRGAARAIVLPLLAGGLAAGAVAGCGSTSAAGSAAGAATGAHSRPTALYRATLAGASELRGGAPAGRGYAIIAFHGPKLLCWRFAHLHGFTSATGAAIAPGVAGKQGPVTLALSSGPRLHHRGCEPVPAATSASIVRHPGAFYVNVFATAHPRGAVRGQL